MAQGQSESTPLSPCQIQTGYRGHKVSEVDMFAIMLIDMVDILYQCKEQLETNEAGCVTRLSEETS